MITPQTLPALIRAKLPQHRTWHEFRVWAGRLRSVCGVSAATIEELEKSENGTPRCQRCEWITKRWLEV